MKPPPPGPVSVGSAIHEAKAAATQASTALPPARRISAPTCGRDRMTGRDRTPRGGSA